MQVRLVDDATETPVHAEPPMETPAPLRNPVPVMVTDVPPARSPEVGAIDTNVGDDTAYVYSPVPVPDIAPFVTTMFTAPAACAGVVAVIEVLEFTVTPVAAVPPKVTAPDPRKFVPVIVTAVPPDVVPPVGETAVTVGADCMNMKSALLPVPDGVVT